MTRPSWLVSRPSEAEQRVDEDRLRSGAPRADQGAGPNAQGGHPHAPRLRPPLGSRVRARHRSRDPLVGRIVGVLHAGRTSMSRRSNSIVAGDTPDGRLVRAGARVVRGGSSGPPGGHGGQPLDPAGARWPGRHRRRRVVVDAQRGADPCVPGGKGVRSRPHEDSVYGVGAPAARTKRNAKLERAWRGTKSVRCIHGDGCAGCEQWDEVIALRLLCRLPRPSATRLDGRRASRPATSGACRGWTSRQRGWPGWPGGCSRRPRVSASLYVLAFFLLSRAFEPSTEPFPSHF